MDVPYTAAPLLQLEIWAGHQRIQSILHGQIGNCVCFKSMVSAKPYMFENGIFGIVNTSCSGAATVHFPRSSIRSKMHHCRHPLNLTNSGAHFSAHVHMLMLHCCMGLLNSFEGFETPMHLRVLPGRVYSDPQCGHWDLETRYHLHQNVHRFQRYTTCSLLFAFCIYKGVELQTEPFP